MQKEGGFYAFRVTKDFAIEVVGEGDMVAFSERSETRYYTFYISSLLNMRMFFVSGEQYMPDGRFFQALKEDFPLLEDYRYANLLAGATRAQLYFCLGDFPYYGHSRQAVLHPIPILPDYVEAIEKCLPKIK